MKSVIAILLATFSLTQLLSDETAKKISLFDGKSFAGWEGDTKEWFRIESGAIVGGSLLKRIPKNQFLCTSQTYTNFILNLKKLILRV